MKIPSLDCVARARTALVIGLILAFASTSSLEAGGAGATLELIPSSATASPGQVVTVDVVISGLGDFASPSAGVFDFDLTFDDSLFLLTGVSFGPLLGDPGMGEAITMTTPPAGGSFNANELSLLTPAELVALQPASFTLLTLTYEAIANGAGVFDLDVLALGDENGAPIAVGAVIPTTVTVTPAGGVVEIPTLSEWGLLLLMFSLLLAGFGRMRRVRS